MQVNSINGLNFKGYVEYPEDVSRQYEDCDFEEVYDEYSGNNDRMFAHSGVDNALAKLKNTVRESTVNVHPITVVAALLMGGAAALTGKDKAVPFIRKTAATITKYSAEGVQKIFGKVFKKANPEGIINKALNNIQKASEAVRTGGEGIEKGKSALINNVEKFIKDCTNDQIAGKVKNFMEKYNIKSPAQVFDLIVAGCMALYTGDVVSDRVEQGADKIDIMKAARQFSEATGIDAKDIIDGVCSTVG